MNLLEFGPPFFRFFVCISLTRSGEPDRMSLLLAANGRVGIRGGVALPSLFQIVSVAQVFSIVIIGGGGQGDGRVVERSSSRRK